MSKSRNIEIERLAPLFKALSNPNRLKIFLRLVSCCAHGRVCDTDNEHACVGEVGEDLGLAPSTVSHHIKELRQAGLIRVRRSGQRIECWVPAEVLGDLSIFFSRCCTGAIDEALQLPTRNPLRSR